MPAYLTTALESDASKMTLWLISENQRILLDRLMQLGLSATIPGCPQPLTILEHVASTGIHVALDEFVNLQVNPVDMLQHPHEPI
jgi:hypothetical protein